MKRIAFRGRCFNKMPVLSASVAKWTHSLGKEKNTHCISLSHKGQITTNLSCPILYGAVNMMFYAAKLPIPFGSKTLLHSCLKVRKPYSTATFCVNLFTCTCRAEDIRLTIRSISEWVCESHVTQLVTRTTKTITSFLSSQLIDSTYSANLTGEFRVI